MDEADSILPQYLQIANALKYVEWHSDLVLILYLGHISHQHAAVAITVFNIHLS